jgi:hypothetical protein
MARKIKIDNAVAKRLANKEKARTKATRSELAYFLIVTEGAKTEPNYFESIRATLPRNTLKHIEVKGVGDNTYRVVEQANAFREEDLRYFSEVWAVFDRDSFPADHFNRAIGRAKTLNIKTAWSNEAFELWYLLHFQFVQNAMNLEQYRPFLEREMSLKMGKPFVYEKNRADMYDLLQTFGDEEKAIERAKKLVTLYQDSTNYADQNPCTQMHILIMALNDLKKKLANTP